MRSHNLSFTLTIMLLAAIVVSCGPSEESIQSTVEAAVAATQEAEPTSVPLDIIAPTTIASPTAVSLPELFITNVDEFLIAASELNVAARQGVTYLDFREYLVRVGAAYDLMEATWPSELGAVARENLAQAVKGWELAEYLWSLQIEGENMPVEPDINRYQEFIQYADMRLVVAPEGSAASLYPGRKYVSSSNKELLLGLASDYFETGRNQILSLLEEAR